MSSFLLLLEITMPECLFSRTSGVVESCYQTSLEENVGADNFPVVFLYGCGKVSGLNGDIASLPENAIVVGYIGVSHMSFG